MGIEADREYEQVSKLLIGVAVKNVLCFAQLESGLVLITNQCYLKTTIFNCAIECIYVR